MFKLSVPGCGARLRPPTRPAVGERCLISPPPIRSCSARWNVAPAASVVASATADGLDCSRRSLPLLGERCVRAFSAGDNRVPTVAGLFQHSVTRILVRIVPTHHLTRYQIKVWVVSSQAGERCRSDLPSLQAFVCGHTGNFPARIGHGGRFVGQVWPDCADHYSPTDYGRRWPGRRGFFGCHQWRTACATVCHRSSGINLL